MDRAKAPTRREALITSLACVLTLALLLLPSLGQAATAEYVEKCGVNEPMRANLWSPLAAARVVPTDAQPWFLAECVDPEQAFDCLLEDMSGEEDVEVRAEGLTEACDDPYALPHLIHLVPAEALRPRSRYLFRCASTPLFADYLDLGEETMTISTGGQAIAQGLALHGLSAELERRDDTCCGEDPLHLVVTVPESDERETFARQGGVIEVLIEGDAWYLPPEGGELPWTDEDITVTSIAANGERWESLRVPASAIPEELVLNNFDCALGRRLSGSALWLLLPLVALRWGRRRARRRDDRRYRG